MKLVPGGLQNTSSPFTPFLYMPSAQIHYLDNTVHHCNSMSQTRDFCDHNKSRLPSIGMELPVRNYNFRRILALNLVALCFGSCQTCTYTKTSGLFYGLILMGLSVFQDPANKTDQKPSIRGFTHIFFLIFYTTNLNRLSSVSEPSPIVSKCWLKCSVPDKSKHAVVSLKTLWHLQSWTKGLDWWREEWRGDKPTKLYIKFSVGETTASSRYWSKDRNDCWLAHVWLTSQESNQVTIMTKNNCHHEHTAVHLLLQYPGEKGSDFLCFCFLPLSTSSFRQLCCV